MFNKIGKNHSIEDAIFLKRNNKTVSDKTISKIIEKTSQNKSKTSHFERLVKTNSNKESLFADKMSPSLDALQIIKNRNVYEQISSAIADSSFASAQAYTKKLLETGVQSNTQSNIFDILTLPMICKKESVSVNGVIKDFPSLDSLADYLMVCPNGGFKAITKMARSHEINQGHYTCIDVLKSDKEISLVVYESAMFTVANSGPNHGIHCVIDIFGRGRLGRYKGVETKFCIIEMGIQKSSSDCVVYSLSTAKNLYKCKYFSERMFALLTTQITIWYEKSSQKWIQHKEKKKGLDLPAIFLKHSTSRSGIECTARKDEVVNKNGLTLLQRINANYQLRGTVNSSISIENKRALYQNRYLNNFDESEI